MNNMILSRRLSIYAMCICICTVLIFSLSSCGKKEAYKGYYVYGLDANEKKVMYEKCNISSEDKTAKSIKKFIRKLQREPDNINMKKAIPDDVKVDNFNISPSGELSLYFNAAYGNYTGVSEILRRAAIVKTLSQIKGIKGIY